jgi:hypothetical protein
MVEIGIEGLMRFGVVVMMIMMVLMVDGDKDMNDFSDYVVGF